ncbi:MAG: hypothetical protein FJX75_18720 [Armatimonadetes bacterium]|nr:hypothetical protein [Armatimonadota bacterium]
MKPCLSLVALLIGGAAFGQDEGPRVALLYSDYGDFRHRDDYDARLAGMEWLLTKFENTHFADLAAQLSRYDLLLGSALFNYSNVQDFAAQREALLTFVRNGGAIVLTDCNYPPMVTWLGALGDGWEVSVANTKAETSPLAWMEAEHVLYTTPNRIDALGGTWAQMQVGGAWTVLAKSEEGGVTAAFRREGKGFLYITSRWPLDERLLTNLWTCLQLSREGLEATLPDLFAFHLGENAFPLRLRNLTDQPLAVRCEIRDQTTGKQPAQVFVGSADVPPGARRLLTVTGQNATRGEHTLRAFVKVNGRPVLDTDPVAVSIPPLLQVRVTRPSYRGAIYAPHPPAEIELECLVTPDAGETLDGLTLVARLGKDEPPVRTDLTEARAHLALPLAGTPQADVPVTVALRRGGTRLASETLTLPVIPLQEPQVSIDEQCATRIAGKPFFPIGIYHASPKDFARLPAMGFNSAVAWGTTVDGAREGLQAAQDAGLKAILELSAFLRDQYNPDGLSQLIDALKSHPALLTWYTVDEPSGKQLDWCRDALRLIRERDPNHPVYLVSCNPGEFALYAPTTEILAIDPYPIPHGSVEMVANWMKAAQAAVGGEQPIWLIPQCHNPIAYSSPTGGRGPTPAEERCMVYLGLIYGAKGIIYYPWDDGPCGLTHDPALMQAVTELNAELADIGPDLLASRRRLIADGTGEHPGLHAATFIGDKRVYLLATNTTNAPLSFSLPFPGAINDAVQLPYEGRTLQTAAGLLADTLAPLQVRLYALSR